MDAPLLDSDTMMRLEVASDNGNEPDGLIVVSPTASSVSTSVDNHHQPWYSNPLQVTAMISNFSTSYNVVNISLVLPLLEQLEPTTSEAKAAVASSLLAGMMVGQLLGGALGDSRLGRLGALYLVMALQIIASMASACIRSDSVYVQLSLWRFLLGVGAGGVYPLAAVLSAEIGGDEQQKESLHRVVLTFSTQGVGFLAVPLVTVVLLFTTRNLQVVWRLLLGLGALPGLVLLLLQCRLYRHKTNGDVREIVPTVEDEVDVTTDDSDGGEAESALDSTAPLPVEEDGTSEPDGIYHDHVATRQGWWDAIRQEEDLCRKLLGTAATWFLFDVLFYGNTLFEPIVMEAAFGTHGGISDVRLLQRTALVSLVLALIALPGYAVAAWLIGSTTCGIPQTPRFVMLQGFSVMAVLYLSIGLFWTELRRFPPILLALYGMTFFFANYGPNTTTFVLPSLVYSPECRSTFNGISAAAGKMGALVGATFFAPAADAWGGATVMVICAGIALVAVCMTKFFVHVRDDSHDS